MLLLPAIYHESPESALLITNKAIDPGPSAEFVELLVIDELTFGGHSSGCVLADNNVGSLRQSAVRPGD
jgi:hypothetical protein